MFTPRTLRWRFKFLCRILSLEFPCSQAKFDGIGGGGGEKGVESKQDQELEILSNTDHKDIPYRNLVVRNSSSYDSLSAKFRNENPGNHNPPFLSPVKFPRFHRLSFRIGSLRRPRFTNEPRYDARKYNPVIDLII